MGRMHLGTPGALRTMQSLSASRGETQAEAEREAEAERGSAMNSNDAALAQLHGLAAPEEVHTVADTAVGTEWRAALNRAEGLRLLRELAWGENLLRD